MFVGESTVSARLQAGPGGRIDSQDLIVVPRTAVKVRKRIQLKQGASLRADEFLGNHTIIESRPRIWIDELDWLIDERSANRIDALDPRLGKISSALEISRHSAR